MGSYPTQPTFPIDVIADPGSGILVSRQGVSLKLRVDPAVIGSSGGSGGNSGTVNAVAAATCGAHRALRSTSDGVRHYSASDPAQFDAYIGVSLAAANTGATVAYQEAGPIDDPAWTWTPGQPVYAGDDGVLTQAEPTAGVSQVVGRAVSATRIIVDRLPPILL